MLRFDNKTYLVTGANSGIGKCVSKQLLENGSRLFMIDRDVDSIEELFRSFPSKVSFLPFDLNHPEKVGVIFDKAKEQGFVFDGLVYCAGISPLMTLKDFELGMFQKTFNVNVISFVAMMQFFTNEEYTNNNSSIVGISSNASVLGGNRQYAYSASKSAMNLIVKSCVKELAQRKTRVNTIMPSTTNTEMVAKLRMQSDAIDMNVKYKMPFGILNPEDISKAIMYLLSEDSSAISGIQLPVNNGEVY
jgi:NAD(P)-dependent dehydrogenase (short-subunit alcohol dehydrogenase family)